MKHKSLGLLLGMTAMAAALTRCAAPLSPTAAEPQTDTDPLSLSLTNLSLNTDRPAEVMNLEGMIPLDSAALNAPSVVKHLEIGYDAKTRNYNVMLATQIAQYEDTLKFSSPAIAPKNVKGDPTSIAAAEYLRLNLDKAGTYRLAAVSILGGEVYQSDYQLSPDVIFFTEAMQENMKHDDDKVLFLALPKIDLGNP